MSPAALGYHLDMGESGVEVLRRWEDHGAEWRAVHVSDEYAIVDLCTCYGEPVDRLESDEADLIAFLRQRRTSARLEDAPS